MLENMGKKGYRIEKKPLNGSLFSCFSFEWTYQYEHTTNHVDCCFLVRMTLFWWTRRDSNPRSLRCERSAFPAKLRAHILLVHIS